MQRVVQIEARHQSHPRFEAPAVPAISHRACCLRCLCQFLHLYNGNKTNVPLRVVVGIEWFGVVPDHIANSQCYYVLYPFTP